MPNHVTTLLTIIGDDATIAACLAKHVVERADGKRQRFALDSIIPMPKSILDTVRPAPWDEQNVPAEQRNYGGDWHVEARALVLAAAPSEFSLHPFQSQYGVPHTVRTWKELGAWIDGKYPGAIFWARRSLIAAAETGSNGWYEWSIANWGTKWDAYDYEPRARGEGSAAIAFETAWSVPKPCLRRLSELWPTLMFAIESIDEGGPEYVGSYANGVETFARCKDEENDARYARVYGRKRPKYDDDGEEIEEEETAQAGAAS